MTRNAGTSLEKKRNVKFVLQMSVYLAVKLFEHVLTKLKRIKWLHLRVTAHGLTVGFRYNSDFGAVGDIRLITKFPSSIAPKF